MVDVARVNMFGRPVGTFRWDERYQVAQFEYDRTFVGRGLGCRHFGKCGGGIAFLAWTSVDE